MKSQAGGPGAKKIAGEAKMQMAERFLKRGFTDKQAKLKIVWETPQIASLCSQMPNLTILMANVAAARDQVKLSRGEGESLRHDARETFAGLPESARQQLAAVDYSRAEQACPHRLAIAQLMRQAAELLA